MTQAIGNRQEAIGATKRVKRLVGPDGSVSVNGVIFNVPQFAGQWVYVYLEEGISDPVQLSPCPIPLRDIIARTIGKKRRLFQAVCYLTGESPANYRDGSSPLEVIDRFHKRVQDEQGLTDKQAAPPIEMFEAVITSPNKYAGKVVQFHPASVGGSL